MDSQPVAPAARAAVFAAVCTLLAVAAHLPMSDAPIPAPAVVFGMGMLFCFARVAALGERGLVSITALVGGSQLGLHLLFQVVQTPAAHPMTMTGMSGMPGMASASPVMGLSAGMTVGHVLAGLATAWWLRRGEAAVHDYARWARITVAAPLRVLVWLVSGPVAVVPSCPATPAGSTTVPAAVRGRLIRFVLVRRGPPAASCC